MATIDYSEFADLALELCTEFGRTVTIVQLDSGSSNPAEPGYNSVDPRTAPLATKTLSAVFVDPSSLQELGRGADRPDWVARSSQIAIVASTENLEKYNELIDSDGARYKITGCKTLKPGPLALVAYLGVSR